MKPPFNQNDEVLIHMGTVGMKTQPRLQMSCKDTLMANTNDNPLFYVSSRQGANNHGKNQNAM